MPTRFELITKLIHPVREMVVASVLNMFLCVCVFVCKRCVSVCASGGSVICSSVVLCRLGQFEMNITPGNCEDRSSANGSSTMWIYRN